MSKRKTKKRVKMDSSLLSFVIIMTIFLFLFDGLFSNSVLMDDVFDFLGLIVVLKGTLLRMVARGHKKHFSKKGQGLVTSGPYKLCRNPMYFGSFLMGCGFVLIVWPWWCLPIFASLFYMRFRIQVEKEEELLTGLFGKEYKTYCAKVPRVFPKLNTLFKLRTHEIFDLDEALSTKEVRGLFWWPVLAVILETLQQYFIFGHVNLLHSIIIFMSSFIVFVVGFIIYYQRS